MGPSLKAVRQMGDSFQEQPRPREEGRRKGGRRHALKRQQWVGPVGALGRQDQGCTSLSPCSEPGAASLWNGVCY